MFRPIIVATELPAVGTARERLVCDFKVVPATARFEMAKDVAAFANAAGGTLLIGASENRATGELAAYVPLTPTNAATARRGYEEAVRDRCHPSPMIAIEEIGHTNGIILAINIWPAIAAPVGVKVRGDIGDGFGGATYVFPMRVATQTVELTPGQLAMLMLPTVRRTIILLSQLQPGDSLTLQYKRGVQLGVRAEDVTFEEVEVLQNRVRLKKAGIALHMPLDAVESVWQDATGFIACVNGNFIPVNGATRWIFYYP